MSGLRLSLALATACFVIAAFRAVSVGSSAPTPADAGHSDWVASSLREMQTIKPGMNREDLLKVFREEGGLCTPTEQRYVYRLSPYIKANVRFENSEEQDGRPMKSPKDKIISISQPFLEWPIVD